MNLNDQRSIRKSNKNFVIKFQLQVQFEEEEKEMHAMTHQSNS